MASLFLMYGSVCIDFIAAIMVIPLLPFLAKKFGVGDTELGYLFAVYNIGSIIGGLLIGCIVGKFGTKGGILFSLLGSALTLLVVPFCESFEQLLVARLAGGLTGNSIPAAMVHIGLSVPKHMRARYMGYVGLSVTTALVLGPLLGGSLSNYGLTVPFYFGSGVALLGAILTVFLFKSQTSPPRPAGETGGLKIENYLTLVLSLLNLLAYSANMFMAGTFLITRFGVNPTDLGLLLAAHGTVSCLNNILLFPRVVRAVGLYGTWLAGNALLLLSFSLVGFAETVWQTFLLLTCVGGIGGTFVINIINPIVDTWTKPYNKARVMGLASALRSVGDSVSPVLWGAWLQSLKDGWVVPTRHFFVGPAASVLPVVLFFALSHRLVWAPKGRQQSMEAKRKQKREREHAMAWKDVQPTDEDYMRLGKRVGQVLTESHYNWTKYTDAVAARAGKLWGPLPLRSIESRMQALWWQSAKADQVAEEYREYVQAEGLLEDLFKGGGFNH